MTNPLTQSERQGAADIAARLREGASESDARLYVTLLIRYVQHRIEDVPAIGRERTLAGFKVQLEALSNLEPDTATLAHVLLIDALLQDWESLRDVDESGDGAIYVV